MASQLKKCTVAIQHKKKMSYEKKDHRDQSWKPPIIRMMIIKENKRLFVKAESKKYHPACLLNFRKGKRTDRLLVVNPLVSQKRKERN